MVIHTPKQKQLNQNLDHDKCTQLMIRHQDSSDADIVRLIRQKAIKVGGNRNLKIYGSLKCKSGKRMKKENRVFFFSEQEAIEHGYRPCGNCMHPQYKKWKNESL